MRPARTPWPPDKHALRSIRGQLAAALHTDPGGARDGYLDRTTVTSRVLYPAMERAGIPRLGPTDEERTFHSLRHTFARRVLESGTPITWVREQLGHSSITVTVDVYGHWETEARKKEAERLSKAFSA